MFVLINKTHDTILDGANDEETAKISYLALKEFYPNDEIEIKKIPTYSKEKMLRQLMKKIEIL